MNGPNYIEIRVWLLRQKISMGQIAEDLGISASAVSQALTGRTPHYRGRRVLEWLRRRGCPKSLLGKTEDLKRTG